MSIPIQNIYYLLSYAWNKLDEAEKLKVAVDDNTELIDLFAKVLLNGSRVLLKRGLDKSYVNATEEIGGIKGKLELTGSLKANSFSRMRAICSYDEFSSDIITNQIIVTTFFKILKIQNLDKELKSNIRQILYRFSDISSIRIKGDTFKSIRLHRNNQFYGFLLNICELIHYQLLPSENSGELFFSDFTRDERKMNQLFESFIYQFYKVEQRKYKVSREYLSWNLISDDSNATDFLPRMITDISLENASKKIIMDAKYYRETMSENYGKEKIKSTNLYQLFSYLMNQRKDEDQKTFLTKGILLYPTIENDYDLKYKYESHDVEIRTVNLNQDWGRIYERLLSIV